METKKHLCDELRRIRRTVGESGESRVTRRKVFMSRDERL